jgi:hypothetical protein
LAAAWNGPVGRRQHPPSRVTIDNSTAEKFTIVATFAYDRWAFYAIARSRSISRPLGQQSQNRRTRPGRRCNHVTDRIPAKIIDEER